MDHTLQVSAFFFNAKTDYLPYYKQFAFSLGDDAYAIDILKAIKAENDNFAYPEENLLFKINDLVVTGKERIGTIVERLGTQLQIDPVLSYRSNHCLVINDDDFIQRFALLEPYATEEDKAYYESHYTLHYASESSKFNHHYIGDAILLLAHRMIANGSEYKKEILEAIGDENDGLFACEYENNLFDAQDHTATIEALFAMYETGTPNRLLQKIREKLSKEAVASHRADSLQGRTVAYYQGHTSSPKAEEIFHTVEQAGGSVVRFSREKRLCGRSLLGRNNNLAYLKAATTLLDALDSGAEVLVVANEEDLAFYNKHYAAIQKRISREIPLALLDIEAFSALADKESAA